MTCHRTHNFGAYATRQGTALLGRIKPILSAGRPEPVGNALMVNVITRTQGGRTP